MRLLYQFRVQGIGVLIQINARRPPLPDDRYQSLLHHSPAATGKLY
ncbi:MAG: hypothetical protein ACT4PZ_19050 [Panacagrimonas sp.]